MYVDVHRPANFAAQRCNSAERLRLDGKRRMRTKCHAAHRVIAVAVHQLEALMNRGVGAGSPGVCKLDDRDSDLNAHPEARRDRSTDLREKVHI